VVVRSGDDVWPLWVLFIGVVAGICEADLDGGRLGLLGTGV
jgi:hypothetical protein